MSTWLITSFGLPVAMTTGRLVVLTLHILPLRPIGAVSLPAGLAVTVIGYPTLVRLRRRHASQRGSSS